MVDGTLQDAQHQVLRVSRRVLAPNGLTGVLLTDQIAVRQNGCEVFLYVGAPPVSALVPVGGLLDSRRPSGLGGLAQRHQT